jgi:phage-related protein
MATGTRQKPLLWMGSSKKDLMKLPSSVVDTYV